jgi:hypothetical protein
MVGALDVGPRTEHRAEQPEFLAAQTLARFRGYAYRAVIFTQQQRAISARDALGHVALLAANRDCVVPPMSPRFLMFCREMREIPRVRGSSTLHTGPDRAKYLARPLRLTLTLGGRRE